MNDTTSAAAAAASSSSSNKNDELISQFMTFTGTSDTTIANSYLEMSGYDVETAVGLYMENEQSTITERRIPTATRINSSNNFDDDFVDVNNNNNNNNSNVPTYYDGDDIRAPDASRTMRLVDDPMGMTNNSNINNTNNMSLMMSHAMNDPSYQMMNALMEEQFQSAFSSTTRAVPTVPTTSSTTGRSSIQNIRAGMSSRRSTIDDIMSDNFDDNDDNNDNEDTKDNAGDDYLYDEDDDDDDDDFHNMNNNDNVSNNPSVVPPVRGLSDMFAPPHHLLHKAGGFTGARAMAKDTKRWLLINIQSDTEFSSHALNRDVWHDELIENLIREGFIFWQQFNNQTEGLTYTQRYDVHDFPHIGIIDPRTGRLLFRREGWTQENPMTAEIFAELAMDFCSRHTFDKPPQAPTRPLGVGSGPGIGVGGSNNISSSDTVATGSTSGGFSSGAMSRPAKRAMHEMSEAEQIEAAMRMSMEDQGITNDDDDVVEVVDINDDTNNNNNKNDDDDDEVKPPASDRSRTTTTTSSSSQPLPTTSTSDIAPIPVTPPSLEDTGRIDELLTMVIPDPPEIGGARIQFRLPDSKKIVRTFAPTDTVKTIYAFLTQTVQEAKDGKEFVLMTGYPPNDLILFLDDTIDDTKLSGQAITMRWK